MSLILCRLICQFQLLTIFVEVEMFIPTILVNIHHGKLVSPVFKSVKYGKHSIKYQCTTEWNKSIMEIVNIFITKYGNSNTYSSFLDLNRKQFKRLIRKIV